MIVFLAGLAVLLALAVLGGRVSTHLVQQGGDRYFDHCDICERRYPRLAGVPLTQCPQGHTFTSAIPGPHRHSRAGTLFIALCAGFALVVVALSIAGVTHLP